MQNKILDELRQLRSAVVALMGTANLPADQQFSVEAINKAAQQFQKMVAEREEWVEQSDIAKYIKTADWRSGDFIRQEFGFNAWIKTGRRYLYNKQALKSLNELLKERNVDLGRYIEYKYSQAAFEKNIATNKKLNKGSDPTMLTRR